MLALQEAIYAALAEVPQLVGLLHFFAAPINTELPYVEYWTGNGTPDNHAGFREEGREYAIFVQSSSRNGPEAMALYELAENKLNYQPLSVAGWQQRGKVVWASELDDPGDATQDDDMVYYAGGVFSINLFRQRTD